MNKMIALSTFLVLSVSSSIATASDEHNHIKKGLDHSADHSHQADAEHHDDHGNEEKGHSGHGDEEQHDDHGNEEKGHDDHQGEGDGHAHGEEEESSATKLNKKQRALAEMTIAPLTPKVVQYELYAPGEIKTNAYKSYLVSPRVDSQVLQRYVTLGEHVNAGDPLIKLFSTTVAQTQSDYRVARSEWLRVSKLGKKTVGAKRYVAAKIDYDNSRKTLLLYGLSEKQLTAIHRNGGKNLGEYTLYAVTSGIVLSDDFHQGQQIDAGTALIELADESQLWVEANVPANIDIPLKAGDESQVKVNERTYTAKFIQISHAIDPTTRTRTIRLTIDNTDHSLHAGLFADVYFQLKTDKAVMVVPDSALMRDAHGDWTVFVETKPGQYQAVEIEIIRRLGKRHQITGIPTNTQVVMKGAFFVASEIAKGGFDPHNH